MNHVSGYKPKKGITRRQFLKGGAAAAVTIASGGLLAACDDSSKTNGTKENGAGGDSRKNGVLKCLLSRLKKVRLRKK